MITHQSPLDVDLKSLVKSMTPTEKAYFKKLSKRYAFDKLALHVKLFQLLDAEKNCSDQDLAELLNVSSSSQLANLKNHLLTELLDSLAFLKRMDDVTGSLNNLIIHAETLIERRLFHTAQKIITKAKKQAEANASYTMLWHILNLEHQYIVQSELKNKQELIEALELEFLHYNKTISQIALLKRYERKAAQLKAQSPLRLTPSEMLEPQTVLNQLMKFKPRLIDHPIILITYYNIESLLAYMCHDAQTCEAGAGQLLELWQRFKGLIKAQPYLFLESISNIFYAMFTNFLPLTMSKAFQTIQELAKQHLKKSSHQAHWQLIRFNTQLKVYHKTFNYVQVQLLMERECEKTKTLALKYVPLEECIPIMASICITHFVLEDYLKADYLIQDIVEWNRTVKREDIFFFCLIFQLLILVELKDYYRLSLAAKNAYHQLYKLKKPRPFEKELLLFLKKLPDIFRSKDYKLQITTFLEALEHYKNDPIKKMHLLYFNYLGWLQSKAAGMSYRQYIMQHN